MRLNVNQGMGATPPNPCGIVVGSDRIALHPNHDCKKERQRKNGTEGRDIPA